jgi:serine/threonine protein kinase
LFPERVAIKIIDKTVLDSKTTKMLLREISVMSSSNHPCLVK